MANTQGELIKLITDTVYENTNQDITGAILQDTLIQAASFAAQNPPVIQNIGIAGVSADGTFTNGSDIIAGNADTTYLDTSYNGLNVSGVAYIQDAGDWYELSVGVNTDQEAQLYSHWNITTDPGKTTNLGALWTGTTITTTIFAFVNSISGNSSGAVISGFGNRFAADAAQNSIVIGSDNSIDGGNSHTITGSSNTLEGAFGATVTGNNNIARGIGPRIIASFSSSTGAATTYCGHILGYEGTITQGDYVIGIGLRLSDNINIAGLSNVVVVKNLMIADPVPEHADNAAAITAGLVAGQIYRTGDLLKVVH
jgi:hypothetical protein